MSSMRFADEVVPRSAVDGLPSRRAKPDPKTLRMATQLIDGLAADWNPDQYHDTYVEELRKRIKAKEAGKQIVDKEVAEPTGGKVLDLMAALEASVKAAKGTKRPKAAAAHKATRKTKKSA
jgi:DNA end-binding protein Ku